MLPFNPFNKLTVQLVSHLAFVPLVELRTVRRVHRLVLRLAFRAFLGLTKLRIPRPVVTQPVRIIIGVVIGLPVVLGGGLGAALLFQFGVQRVRSKRLRKPLVHVLVEVVGVDPARMVY